ncbi:trypsin-like peptidase domain-containing protein [Candidatus Woesearchaeota archaeon]|nr:trypsin-like peptidase domain-containing protein [Candidatus Woesearchaeota archaeon]HIH39015.1 trypsin-like serine protease [Candidatus Woesearchaeota archaeon]HIH49233.1 trypsin-like serine protease [Candidatus Woesearchaeota archaeon]HIJ03375.1 trypsin-like serine protease [Candidatus Woesearchaeota archaeon]
MNDETRQHMIYGLVLIIILLGGYAYHVHTMTQLRHDFLLQLVQSEENIKELIDITTKQLIANDQQIQDSTTKQINQVTSILEDVEKQSSQQISQLNADLAKTQAESKQQLDDLSKQVSTINVKSKGFSDIIPDLLPKVVSVRTDLGLGSGAIVSSSGHVVTNYHVIKGIKALQIRDYEGNIYQGALIGYDEAKDIALLRIVSNNDFPSFTFGDSDAVRVGETVIAIGSPSGLDFTVTEGIISAVNRVGPNGLSGYLQTDVPINPGNSGGPLVDSRGEIIGINNFKLRDAESLGFAIGSNQVKDTVDTFI